ncbi:LysR substrate-binding domain-containing protein [Undibacterium sp.]|jgi:DNA-binding transcriptional LysR family regulator|uniref:LysR substrate-binding domain-containing protein n=1 Tax=Undibacterium sp. TaxID=1914977 RepID=UPI002C982BE7|nr:LysR substrate-binding domain-containing protein [Undibacterium sp.]HTD05915.1 LysR substrate-binding domain-containing protein [Undibacterium sp.]
MRFDLTDLQLFLHVAEAGSITSGAERTHLALASASARLRGMEDLLGVPLLLRKRRGVEVTDAGRTLLHHARAVTQQMDRMRGDLGEYAQGLKGQIRLLCNTAALMEFLSEALASYMKTHPHVNIDVDERLSYDIVQALTDGLADIGIIADSVASAGLQTLPFRDDRLVVVAAPDHALALAAGSRRSISFAEILEHDFIGLAGDSALQQHLGEHAAKLGRRLRYRVRLRSFDAICRMVESGVGIAVVPQTAAARYKKTMALRQLRLTDAWAMRHLLICVRNYDDLPAYARSLVDAIRA